MPRTRRPVSRAPLTLPWPAEPVATSMGTVQVEPDPDHPHTVTVYVNGAPSSCLNLADPGYLAFEYMQQMAALVDNLPPGPLRVVHLGAAGCSMARYIDHIRPGSRQVGVDIDDRLMTLMREWFNLPRSPRLRLRADDARHALTTLPPASADVIIRDVFFGDTTPEHLVTSQFVTEIGRALRPGGLYLANCADRPPLALAKREVATLAHAWPAPPAIAADTTTNAADPWPLLGLVTEPAILRGRRFGNVVLAAVKPNPTETGEAIPAWAPASGESVLGRALRCLPVPATMLSGAELANFARGAWVLQDPPHGQ